MADPYKTEESSLALHYDRLHHAHFVSATLMSIVTRNRFMVKEIAIYNLHSQC